MLHAGAYYHSVRLCGSFTEEAVVNSKEGRCKGYDGDVCVCVSV